MEFLNTQVFNLQGAFRGMRQPLQSFDKSDSCNFFNSFIIGEKDMELAQNLLSSGSSSDDKFMRQIFVTVDIVAPSYFLSELDTYKVATTRNSSSLQHKGMSRDYTLDDFTFDEKDNFDLNQIIDIINKYRRLYKETNDYKYFRMMRQLMPMGYEYNITWTANYEVLRNIYFQRKNHRLKEWSEDFMGWIDDLPYSEQLIKFKKGGENK